MSSVRAASIARGDVVWASFDPAVGREQAGHRPFLVLSDERLHTTRHLVIAVPMTTADRPWPTRWEVAPGSYAICEQPHTIALEHVTRHDAARHDVAPVRAILNRLIGA